MQKHFNQLVCASQIPSIAPSHFSAQPFSFRVAGSLAGITNHDGIAPRRPKPAKTNIINMVCFSPKAFEKSSPSSSNSSLHVVAHPIDLILWLEAAKSIHLLINGVLINAGDCL